MKFKAVVITRKKLITALLLSAMTAAVAVAEAAVNITPKLSSGAYDKIINSALVTDGEKRDVKKTIASVLGFDISKPETIIDEYAGTDTEKSIAEKYYADKDEEEHESAKEEGADIYEEATHGEPPFPSKEEIAKAKNLSINNATDYEVDLEALCAENLAFSIDNDGPQVLIMHTHTTECYSGDEMPGETERTTDKEKSVAAIGDVIAETLERYGILVYHDTTFHDYPSYQGSYTRSMATVSDIMEKNPSIKIVLDVHRDAFVYTDGTRLRVTNENADVPTAQVMLVSGTDSMGLYNPDWRENLKFAAKIQNAAEIMYPGLMRSIDLRTERFNLHMTKGSLILEVGSNGNTLEEAKNAGHDVARAIAAVLQ